MTIEQFNQTRFSKGTKVYVYNKEGHKIIANVIAIDFEFALIAVNPDNIAYKDLEELEWHNCNHVNIVQ